MRHLSRLSFPIPTYLHIPKDTLGLTITSPLHIYRNLVASNLISADPNQHRAAIVIQGVYERLLDYKLERYTDLKKRLDAVTNSLRALEDARKKTSQSRGAGGGGLQKPRTTWRDSPYLPTSLQSPQAQSKALIRTFSRDEELLNISSPRGLLLSGNVGCGKSMLTDILAESLPVKSKRRVHFDTFMLGVYGMLEDFRIKSAYSRHDRDIGEGYSILHVAKEMVENSTVLILDEFQMPDKASGKILKSLLNAFFLMGGVLIATSNRLPETLVSAEWRKKEEFGVFEEVLKRRCEIWDMNGGVDWRRRSGEGRIVQVPANIVGLEEGRVVEVPKFYFLKDGDMQEAWEDAVEKAADGDEEGWMERGLVVYGREILLKRARNGAAFFNFDELCVELLGPADYITIASNFSTIIIDKVPVLTSKSHRHEARRFITLLDAIYECRCKLLIRAEVPIENLFFPDAAEKNANSQEEDSIHSEAFAEAHQDLTVPFRPNVSLYEQLPEDPNDPLTWKRKKYTVADQDSDFRGKVDFTSVKKYTGEDEKFSFKRAVSRVWEVCGERWWDALSHSEKEFPVMRRVTHSPMPRSLRRWEGDSSEADTKTSHPAMENDIPTTPLRPDAPQFTPVHIWGVIDNWGKRAGRWGKGVNAYKDGDTRDKSPDTRSAK